MKRKKLCAVVASILLTTAAMDLSATPPSQTTAFSYQGQLNAGGILPTGLYQFTFTLYDSPTGGSVVVGTSPIRQPIQVINGLFTSDLNFGQIFNGAQYWLDIQVGTTLANEETLTARQPINAVPVAQWALNSPAGKAGLVFAANIINPFTASSFFFPPNGSGDTTGGGNWVTYDKVAIPMPVGCTFDRLYLNLSAVPPGLGGGGPTTVTLWVNGIGTPLSASGDTTLGPATSSATGSVTVNAGDTVALEATGAGLMDGQGTINASLHCL